MRAGGVKSKKQALKSKKKFTQRNRSSSLKSITSVFIDLVITKDKKKMTTKLRLEMDRFMYEAEISKDLAGVQTKLRGWFILRASGLQQILLPDSTGSPNLLP